MTQGNVKGNAKERLQPPTLPKINAQLINRLVYFVVQQGVIFTRTKRLSVLCNVRAPYSASLDFRQCFHEFCTFAIG